MLKSENEKPQRTTPESTTVRNHGPENLISSSTSFHHTHKTCRRVQCPNSCVDTIGLRISVESMVLDRARSTSTTNNAIITIIVTARGGRVRGSGSGGYGCDSSSGGSRRGAGAHARARACGSSGIQIANRHCQVVAGFGEATGERDVVVAMAAGVYHALDVAHLARFGLKLRCLG